LLFLVVCDIEDTLPRCLFSLIASKFALPDPPFG
jgi:hypothetical protein